MSLQALSFHISSDTLYSLLLNKMRFSVAQATALLALLTTAQGLNINRFIEVGVLFLLMRNESNLAILPSELKTSSRVAREASAAGLGATEANMIMTVTGVGTTVIVTEAGTVIIMVRSFPATG